MNKSTADISASEVEGSASALPSRRDPKHQDGQHLSVSLSACLFCPSIVCISVGIPPHVSRSLSIYLCLPVCLSIYRYICLSLLLSLSLVVCLFLLLLSYLYLCMYMYLCDSIYINLCVFLLSVCLACLSVLFLCPSDSVSSVCLSVCLFVCRNSAIRLTFMRLIHGDQGIHR